MSNSSKEEPERFKAPEKFYVAEKADNEVGLNRLAELIPYQCTVTASDCYAVLLSLEHNIASELDQGCIVKLRRLGNFQVRISSEEKEIASEAAAITKRHILLRPAKKLRTMLVGLYFNKNGKKLVINCD